MKYILIAGVLLIAFTVFADPGDIIDTWYPSGHSNPRGLAVGEWGEGGEPQSIWVAGPVNVYNCTFALLDNTDDHNIIQDWQQFSGAYWCFDIGFPYNYGGNDCIVAIDQNSPRLRLYDPNDGSHVDDMSDAFSGGYDEGCDCDPDTNYVYVTNYNFNDIKEWDGSSWSTFATCPGSPTMGVAVGWDHVLVVTTQYDYTIYIYDMSGNEEYSIPLNSWSSNMVGMCCAHRDRVGNNESVYLAIFYPYNAIAEVEIEDLYGTTIESVSAGTIKALFH